MAADNMPHTAPAIVTHFSPEAIPAIDAASEPKKAATDSQNLRLVSFLVMFCLLCQCDDEKQKQTQNKKTGD